MTSNVFYGLLVPVLTFAVLTLQGRWPECEEEAECATSGNCRV